MEIMELLEINSQCNGIDEIYSSFVESFYLEKKNVYITNIK